MKRGPGIPLRGGYVQITDKDGKTKIVKKESFGLSASAKIAKRKKTAKPKLKRTR